MSLASDIKEELLRTPFASKQLRATQLSALLRLVGSLQIINGRVAVEIALDSHELGRQVVQDVSDIYGLQTTVARVPATGSADPEQVLLRVRDRGEILARQTGLLNTRGQPVRGLANRLTTGGLDDNRAVLRGAFLARGRIGEPSRTAVLEISAPTLEVALALAGACSRLGVDAKVREIRGTNRIIVRDADAVHRLLLLLGAEGAAEVWNRARVTRADHSPAQRLVNFDDANLRRSADAAAAACARVERALEILGDSTPRHLRYAGELRLELREASLDELGHKANPPMTKDAVAGRIRRLLSMADKRAAELGVPNTEQSVGDL